MSMYSFEGISKSVKQLKVNFPEKQGITLPSSFADWVIQ